VKVTARSSTALVIRDTSALARTMGAFCFLFGALFVAIASQGALSVWEHTVPAVIGVLLAVAGLLTLLLPSTQTFVFDKAQRLLVITREAAFRRPVHESVELKDITAIDLERSGDGELGALFRIALVLANGARRPWTSYYQSGGTQMRAIVDIVRNFLQLETPAPTNTAVHLVAILSAAQRRSTAWLLAGGIALCLVFLAIGTRLLWLQEVQLARYVPVAMNIDSARIDAITDNDGVRTFRPVISYHYELAGQRYKGHRVTPLNTSGNRAWAEARLREYGVGRAYVGYHDPATPDQSFLARERAALPYLFMIIPVFGLIVCAMGVVGLRKVEV
jgi:uncharacterized protein DUF3592